MAMTNKHPIDYQKRIVIVSQLARVCTDCGSYAALLPAGWVCVRCQSTNVAEVWEHMLDAFRRGLAEIKAGAASGKAAPSPNDAQQVVAVLSAQPAERR